MPSVSYVYPSKPKAEVILINDTIEKILIFGELPSPL